jgi:Rieske Fe-S protein
VDAGIDANCTPTCTEGPKTLFVDFATNPKLKTVGDGVTVTDASFTDTTSCAGHLVFVAQPSAGTYVAVSGTCTHLCCQAGGGNSMFLSNPTTIYCPCHGSMYNLDGTVKAGAVVGQAPLQKLTVACSDACGVYITLP